MKFKIIDNFVVAGYASTRIEDIQGDVFTPDMLRESAKEYMENGVVFLSHNRTDPAGLILAEHRGVDGKMYKTEVDEVGWFVVSRPSAANKKIMPLIEQGLLTAYSIGGRRLADGRIEINDLSYVPKPANKLSYHKIISKSDDIHERLKGAKSLAEGFKIIREHIASERHPEKG